LIWVVVASWTGSFAGDIVCWTLLRRREAIRVRRPDADEVIGLLTRGLPFLGSALLIQAIINLDVIVLGVLRSTRDVGIYSAAFRLAFFALMLAGLVATAVFPQLVHRWQADRMSFQRLLARLIRLAIRVSLAPAVFVIAEAPTIIRFLYG